MKNVLPRVEKVYSSTEFVGIKVEDGKTQIFVPAFFRDSDDVLQQKKNLPLFLKSIELAKTVNKKQNNDQESYGNSWSIDSYLWLIKDFLNNGYFHNRNKQYFKDGKGRINWKRTLRTTPIISNKNLIYDKLITSRSASIDSEITLIHKYCLSVAVERMKWFFPNLNVAIDKSHTSTTKEMINTLKKYQTSTYDDTKIMRFNHMMAVLTQSSDNAKKSKVFSYGIDNYYYVYEKMIDNFFGGIKDTEKGKYNPSGYWHLNDCDYQSANLRPDTVYKLEDKTYILDAKMYKYGVTHDIEDLPSTSSMQKQITYGDFVKNTVDTESKVRNAFIIPYNKELEVFKNDASIEKFNDGNLAYIGYAYVDWRNDNKLDHDRIFTYLIDFNYLLLNYKKTDAEMTSLLIRSIEAKLKSN